MDTNIVIIGAGLAGMSAAIRLHQLGYNPILINTCPLDTTGNIGGFASFSGAKFSLPPAGLGLINITKTEDELKKVINNVLELFDLSLNEYIESNDSKIDLSTLRNYKSLVLMPNEINELINRLLGKLNNLKIKIINGYCNKIEFKSNLTILHLIVNNHIKLLNCNTIFFAGGRIGSNILLEAGIEPTNIKGLDVGVRIEFKDPKGLFSLRKHGPDAKIIKGNCRTFCLNSPGLIYRYPYQNITIPGGIVAYKTEQKCNVGILFRSKEKNKLLNRILKISNSVPKEILEMPHKVNKTMLGSSASLINKLYGPVITKEIQDFGKYLSDTNLIDWSLEHYIHIPLIDWHWSTFSIKNSFKTSNSSIYCVGDSSGHARGLLQAAVSGWLGAEEYANENLYKKDL
ncbi:MAG: FAD-dependent oxidoreductase [Nitrososphaeraceae archaeon]